MCVRSDSSGAWECVAAGGALVWSAMRVHKPALSGDSSGIGSCVEPGVPYHVRIHFRSERTIIAIIIIFLSSIGRAA